LGNIHKLYDILLVSIGAALGVNTRFIIFKKLQRININKNIVILLINTLACLLFGAFFSALEQLNNLKFSYHIGLFVLIGFLGSLSTFSTFISDLFELLIQNKLLRGLKLFIVTIILGLVAFQLGRLIGN